MLSHLVSGSIMGFFGGGGIVHIADVGGTVMFPSKVAKNLGIFKHKTASSV